MGRKHAELKRLVEQVEGHLDDAGDLGVPRTIVRGPSAYVSGPGGGEARSIVRIGGR